METEPPPRPKIVSIEQLRAIRERCRREGRSVVQCHGCFDIVHPGHVRHLQHAARQGDVLVVSITADGVMGKGDGRPLFPQELRAENLAALDCVDWVCINPEPTATGLLEVVRPDIYVKGREYENNDDPRFHAERETVERHGGRVLFSSGDIVFSSTALVSAMEHTAAPSHARLKTLAESHALTPARLEPLVASFVGRRVCVVGETIIDTYVFCDRPEVAGESPVMSLRPLDRRSFDGGAAVVARHLAAMGARPTLVTALPRSPEAEALRQRLGAQGIEVASVDLDGPMLEKQRFLVGAQKVMKLDLVQPVSLDSRCQGRLIRMAQEASDEGEACILADFGQGMLSPGMLNRMCEALRPGASLLAGDVSGRRSSLLHMREMDLLCPTEAELRDAMNDYEDSLNAVAWRFMQRTGARSLFVTISAEGVIAFDRTGEKPGSRDWSGRLRAEHVPTIAPHAIDALGCGDAMLAAATLARLAGGSLVDAAYLGSIAAGAEAHRVGNEAITAKDLRAGIHRLCESRLTISTVAPTIRAVV